MFPFINLLGSVCIQLFFFFLLFINPPIRQILIGVTTTLLSPNHLFTFFQKVKDIPIGPSDTKEKTTGQKLAEKVLWFISTARNILVVIFCGLLGYYYDLSTHGKVPFKLSGELSIPSVVLKNKK